MTESRGKRKPKTVACRRCRGFTLLEVMIALIILAFALLGLAGLQVTSVQGNSLASQITEATTLAQNELEQLMATPFENLVGLGTVTNDVIGTTGVNYNVEYIVTPDPGGSRADVTVTVQWVQDAAHGVTVNSVISQF